MNKLTSYKNLFIKNFKKYKGKFLLKNAPEASRDRVVLQCTVCNRHTTQTANTVKGKLLECSNCKMHSKRKARLLKFKTSAELLHSGKFNYSGVMEVLDVDTPIPITCNKCMAVFHQSPYAHLNTKYSCPICVGNATSKRLFQDLEQFKIKVLNTFGDVYTYENSIYRGMVPHITVNCNKCKESITSSPYNILNRVTSCLCQNSNTRGFQENLPAILYYIKVSYKGLIAYKIGITNKTVTERFKQNKKGDIIPIKIWEFSHGRDARIEETRILKDFKVYKWVDIDLLTDGNTELFYKDVLELDHE